MLPVVTAVDSGPAHVPPQVGLEALRGCGSAAPLSEGSPARPHSLEGGREGMLVPLNDNFLKDITVTLYTFTLKKRYLETVYRYAVTLVAKMQFISITGICILCE